MNFLVKKEIEDEDEPEQKRIPKSKIKSENRINPTEDTPLLNKILMKRDTLFQLFNKVHFEKMVENCLIKINYGNTPMKDNYKIGLIKGVEQKEEKYEYEGKLYNFYLRVFVGDEKLLLVPMMSASNKEIHESQAYRLLEELQESSQILLDKRWLEEKIN